ncbi:MAG TPA: SGNH hydrolase domain-containing protein, partial [Gaiellaceae bacterium]
DAELGPVVRAEESATAAVAGTHSIDFAPVLCPGARCTSTRGHTVMYRNASHLSVAGSLELTGRLRAAIARDVRR